MITVKATREGLVGQKTSTGWIIDDKIPFVALPSVRALHKTVHIINPLNGNETYAIVLDVGPFNEHDDSYIFSGQRPQAESGTSVSGKGTNGAGIDLGEKTWNDLGMLDNTEVSWEFIK